MFRIHEVSTTLLQATLHPAKTQKQLQRPRCTTVFGSDFKKTVATTPLQRPLLKVLKPVWKDFKHALIQRRGLRDCERDPSEAVGHRARVVAQATPRGTRPLFAFSPPVCGHRSPMRQARSHCALPGCTCEARCGSSPAST